MQSGCGGVCVKWVGVRVRVCRVGGCEGVCRVGGYE